MIKFNVILVGKHLLFAPRIIQDGNNLVGLWFNGTTAWTIPYAQVKQKSYWSIKETP